MTRQKFIFHDDIIESAASGISLNHSEDDTCLRLLIAIYERDNRLIVSRSIKKKYIRRYSNINKNKTPINPIVPSLLPEIFVSSNKVIDLKDSTHSNPNLEECENKIINLWLDDRESVIVTQNNNLIEKALLLEERPKVINPSEALALARSD